MTNLSVTAPGGAMSASGRLSRRAALSALASVPAFALPASALAFAAPPTLSALIEKHRVTRDACERALRTAAAAEPPDDALVEGFGGVHYSLALGSAEITKAIEKEFAWLTWPLDTVSRRAPELARATRAVMDAEKEAALGRLAEAFAVRNAAFHACDEAEENKVDALTAVCAHRCATSGELAAKARYLASWRDELSGAPLEALFASLLPDGEGLTEIAA
jgi:hypothetical protein